MSAGQWGVAEAKQRLSEVLRAASRSPQVITNRDEPVGAVVGVALLHAVQQAQAAKKPSLADRFVELRALCAETGCRPRWPRRRDRAVKPIGDERASAR
jgi:prevent-host-death family protein